MRRSIGIYRPKGFTLIELLIVVAIIAILAAIAVPNFLEAQTRSKVSRVRADQRTLSIGCEAYAVDNNKYPPNRRMSGNHASVDMVAVTTPVAYLTSANLLDPFHGNKLASGGYYDVPGYGYYNYQINPERTNWMSLIGRSYRNPTDGICFTSWGPDKQQDASEWVYIYCTMLDDPETGYSLIYDPTNGTISNGDVVRYAGVVPGVPNF